MTRKNILIRVRERETPDMDRLVRLLAAQAREQRSRRQGSPGGGGAS